MESGIKQTASGILAPAETRAALALGLEVACRAPIPEPSYGVFRM